MHVYSTKLGEEDQRKHKLLSLLLSTSIFDVGLLLSLVERTILFFLVDVGQLPNNKIRRWRITLDRSQATQNFTASHAKSSRNCLEFAHWAICRIKQMNCWESQEKQKQAEFTSGCDPHWPSQKENSCKLQTFNYNDNYYQLLILIL